MSNKTGNTLLALLAGAAIGAGIGILFAPDKGSKTRSKIKEGFDDQKDLYKEKFNDASEKIKNKISEVKMDLESGFESLLSQTEHKKEDVIATLERKLEELKKQTASSKR